MKYVFPVLALGLLGCTELGLDPAPKPAPEAASQPTSAAPPPPPAARTVEQFDTTTQAQRAAASEPASGGRSLGTVVASLGDPSTPGFWIETSLVKDAAKGRIMATQTGQSVEVELRPTDGSARVSLAAWRLLEVPLTALAEVEVFVN